MEVIFAAELRRGRQHADVLTEDELLTE